MKFRTRYETWALFRLAFPVVLTQICFMALQTIDRGFVGHIGKAELAASALAYVYFNILWFTLLGVSTALDTLASQSYGTSEYHHVNLHAKRASIILSILFIPVAFLMYYSSPFLRHIMGQKYVLAEMAIPFLRRLIPGVWFFIMSIVMMKYLMTQNVMAVNVYIGIISIISDVAFNWLFIHHLQLGFLGSPWATTTARATQCLLYVLYITIIFDQQQYAKSTALERELEMAEIQEDEANQQEEDEAVHVTLEEDNDDGSEEADNNIYIGQQSSIGDIQQLSPSITYIQIKSNNNIASGAITSTPLTASSLSTSTTPLLSSQQYQPMEYGTSKSSNTSSYNVNSGILSYSSPSFTSQNNQLTAFELTSPAMLPQRMMSRSSLLTSPLISPGIHQPYHDHIHHHRYHLVSHTLLQDWKHLWNKDEFIKFLRLGIPGGIMFALEAWSFEALSILASHISVQHQDTRVLSAHFILMTYMGLIYFTLPFGAGVAASIRVGNLLGAQRPTRAKLTSIICVIASLCFMVISGLVLYWQRYKLGHILTHHQLVLDTVASVCPIVVLVLIWDGIQGVCSGILRGMGRQKTSALINLCSMWLLGVIPAYIFCFQLCLNLKGLWWGMCCGMFSACACYAYVLYHVNWREQALGAISLNKHHHQIQDELQA